MWRKRLLIVGLIFAVILLLAAIPLWLLFQPAAITLLDKSEARSEPDREPEPCGETLPTGQPPCHPGLARSPWSISHRTSYAQGSSPLWGPTGRDEVSAEHLNLPGIPITLGFTEPFPDGGINIWASPLSILNPVVKIDHDTMEIIDLYLPHERESEREDDVVLGISGAYNLVDRDNRFIVGRQRAIEVFADQLPGDRFSPITLVKRFPLPATAFCGPNDLIVGLGMSYDEHLIAITERGMLIALPRTPDDMTEENVVAYSLNGETCSAGELDPAALEIVSNNIALDEEGGVYVVTSQQVHRVQWDGRAFSPGWSATYEVGDRSISAIRLGPGSGSTPSLMGNGSDQDKFVVLTDGQELMHLVLMWRDNIPADWEPLTPEKDRRIACEFPITFGDPKATESLSEQSVLVHDQAAVVVNNLLQEEPAFWSALPPFLQATLAAGASGDAAIAPYGLERVDWNPQTRRCEQIWTNSELSIPNGIPTMSATGGIMYGIGQRAGVWGLEALDFADGRSLFFVPSAAEQCQLDNLRQIDPGWLRLLAAARVPFNLRVCENAYYAATEIGPDRSIYTGTFYGMSRFMPLATKSP